MRQPNPCKCFYALGDGETEHQAWDNGHIVYCPLHAQSLAMREWIEGLLAELEANRDRGAIWQIVLSRVPDARALLREIEKD